MSDQLQEKKERRTAFPERLLRDESLQGIQKTISSRNGQK